MLTAIWDFLFHRHEWKELMDSGDIRGANGDKVGVYFISSCKKCGKIKAKKWRV